jgi:hypothetical protein
LKKEKELARLIEEDPSNTGDGWWIPNRWNQTGFRSWLTSNLPFVDRAEENHSHPISIHAVKMEDVAQERPSQTKSEPLPGDIFDHDPRGTWKQQDHQGTPQLRPNHHHRPTCRDAN